MKYVQPIGGAANAPYIDANPGSGTEGSAVPAAAIEHPQREIEAVITGAGLVAATGDLTQLRQAIAKMIQAGQHSVIFENVTFAGAVTGTGKAVYWDFGNSRFDLALADGSAKQEVCGFADVPNACIYAFGKAALFAGLTPGRYYLDGTTAGAITKIAPANTVSIGIAKSASELFIDVDEYVVVTSSSDPMFVDDSEKPASTGWIRRAMAAVATAAGFFIDIQASFMVVKFPSWLGSVVIQMGTTAVSASTTVGVGSSVAITLPMAFTTVCKFAGGSSADGWVTNGYLVGAYINSLTQISLAAVRPSGSMVVNINWIAIGK